MAGEEARALSVEEAKRRLLEEEPAASGAGSLEGLVRAYPLLALAGAAVAGVVLMRSRTAQSMAGPIAAGLARSLLG